MIQDSCQIYREELSALRHGEEPGIPAEDLRAHLDSCTECRRAHEQAAAVSELLRSCQPPLPADGLDRLSAAVRELAARSVRETAPAPARGRGAVVSLKVAVFAAAAAAVIALLVGYVLLAGRPAGAAPQAAPAAMLTAVSGRAELDAAGAKGATAAPARPGMALDAGRSVSTGRGGSLCLVTGRGARIELDDDSAMVVLAPDAVRLVRGRLVAAVEKGAEPFRVATGEAEVVTLGTRFSVEADGAGTRVTVIEGRVRFANLRGRRTQPVEVSAGQTSLVAAGAAPSRPESASAGDLGELLPAPAPALEVVFVPARKEVLPGGSLSARAELVNNSGEELRLDNVARSMPVLFVRLVDSAGRSSFACPSVTGATVDGRPLERAEVVLEPGSRYKLELDLGAALEAPGEHRLSMIYFGTIRCGAGTWSGSLESRAAIVDVKSPGRPKTAGQGGKGTAPAPLGGDAGRTTDGTR